MSAYIVNKETIQYLCAAMLSRRITQSYGFSYWNGRDRVSVRNEAEAAQVGNLLWQENVASVNARYTDNEPTPLYSIEASDLSRVLWQEIDPLQVIKACHCLEYQSCEHDGWEASIAHRILQTLIKCACHALAGYDKASWGAPEVDSIRHARIKAEMFPKLQAQLARN
jgi:hypothetical protein